MKIATSKVRKVLDIAYPDYKGRKAYIEFTDKVQLHDLYWDGGTRNYFVSLSHNGISSPHLGDPWTDKIEGSTVDILPNVLIVKHSYFCGTDMGVTIYAHPSLAPKLITD